MPASGEFTPLEMDRYITGLVTQRNPLRDASVPYTQSKVYNLGRYDSIIDGLNTEITSALTLGRRPGNTPYNSNNFPPVNRFYEHRIIVDGVPSIKVMVDCAATVYDGTGPSTKTTIWTKSAGGGKTFFQSVGNTLFFTNGVDRKKWFIPVKGWHATTTFTAGDTILDSNNNIQVAFGPTYANIISSHIDNFHSPGFPPSHSTVNLTYQGGVSPFVSGQEVTFENLSGAAVLNGQTLPVSNLFAGVDFVTIPVVPAYVFAAENGIAFTDGTDGKTGVSGGAQPVWLTTPGAITVDGTVRWVCKGSSVTDWGTDGPAKAPTVNQAMLPTTLAKWQANTFYTALPFILPVTGTGVSIQQLTVAGVTAGAAPTYSLTPGTNTVNGGATYTCINYIPTFATVGDGNWPAASVVSQGAVYAVLLATGAYLMQVIQGGTTGATQPNWSDAFGNLQTDNTVVWQNLGKAAAGPPLSTKTAIESAIVDVNGFLESVNNNPGVGAFGTSGATVPTWPDGIGVITEENAGGQPLFWLNSAAFAPAFTDSVLYYFSFRSSVTKTESNLSPPSTPITKLANDQVQVQGFGSADRQIDTIRVYRTEQGQSIPVFVADLPAPITGAAGLWTYDDTSADADTNIFIQGAQSGLNSRPPVGLGALSYHEGRIWGLIGNLLQWTAGPDETPTNGNGQEAWPPGNVFAYPDYGVRTEPVSIDNGGLFVFTASDLWAVRGDGTASNPFRSARYARGIGLLNYDALDIIGATIHMQTTARKQISLDPSAGYIETGQVIGDQFKRVTTGGFNAALFSPATAFVTWHEAESGDTGLIVADGAVGWFRYSPTTSPETGFLWNTFAAIEGGTSAVQSVETSPGIKQLLIGPSGTGKILARNTSINSDNAVPYTNTYVAIGSIQLCHPYELAEVGGIVLDSKLVGTAPTCGVLFGEVKPTANVPFDMLTKTSDDPPLLPPSETLYSDRFDTLQNGQCILHRHIQLLIQWTVEDFPSELLTHTILVKVSSEIPS